MPIQTKLRVLTAPAAGLLLAAFVLAGCGAGSNPHPDSFDSYVSMGDSYTALAGVGPFSDPGCKRSKDNYPSLVARDLRIKNFTDASCGGATSAALTQDQVIKNPAGSRGPQLAAVSKKTKLVTLGIGLNNYQLAYYLLYVCIPINGITVPACSQYLKLPDSSVRTYVESSTAQVKDNLEDIRKAAPNARVVLVGYPRILADEADCPSKLAMPSAAASRLRLIMQTVNEQYAKLAKKTKVDYVDTWSVKGHDVCSSDPWMAGQTDVPGKALSFHPYESYAKAVAEKIEALLKK